MHKNFLGAFEYSRILLYIRTDIRTDIRIYIITEYANYRTFNNFNIRNSLVTNVSI